ncbi:uncharacterized protein PFL1_02782 [Pseudozyma flocculosa PF-1]|uniref:Uncharacterized protein n=2 Tax=Pseudozyma flocculosa TaxID=84751 RepID=A0A5C3F106_9BASI|nr:uncharacterized protein PFL1_02782 [Pseudozyma flocculosa PF-1]EPQ29563.1 hypothetical protein PFL1_02782 [Pseudozyma flocculosa PF-1]SPO38108.1 uncharacterized protein PSFLO_03585 [Pseudozyma flocculosa]
MPTLSLAPSDAASSRRARRGAQDDPSSDATLWEGFASDLDGVLTPPAPPPTSASRLAPDPAPTLAPGLAADNANAPCDPANGSQQGQSSSQGDAPTQETDQRRRLLRELGWDSSPRAQDGPLPHPPPAADGAGADNGPRSSFSIDGADVGAPWSQTGLFPTPYMRDRWLIGVGLKKPPSSGSAKVYGDAVVADTDDDLPSPSLQEVQPPSPGKLGLGQMQAACVGPKTFVVPPPAGATTPRRAVAANDSNAPDAFAKATPVPRRAGGLLDQLDAQISGFKSGADGDKSVQQRQSSPRFPPSVSNRSKPGPGGALASPATSAATPANRHAKSIASGGSSSRKESGVSDKENRRPQRTATSTPGVGVRTPTTKSPVLCIDSDDDDGCGGNGHGLKPRRPPTSASPKRKESNAFDVLLKSPERAAPSHPRTASRPRAPSSPGKLRLSSSNVTAAPRQAGSNTVDATQARLDLSLFRASGSASATRPTQDRSPPARTARDAQRCSENEASDSTHGAAQPTSAPRASMDAPSSSEDSIGLRAFEEQDWMLGIDEEDELRRIEAAIAADGGPDSDPIFIDDERDNGGPGPGLQADDSRRKGDAGAPGPSTTSAPRPRLTIPLRPSVAQTPAVGSAAPSAAEAAADNGCTAVAPDDDDDVQVVEDPDPDLLPCLLSPDTGEGRRGLSIKLISDLSQDTQAMFHRQATGKRKASDGDDDDSFSTTTRRGRGKGKTWESTWADDQQEDQGGDDDDDDDDDQESGSSGARTSRQAGTSTLGRGRGRGSSRGRAKSTTSGRGGSQGRTGGSDKAAYFKKKAWQAKRGARRR